MVAERWAESGRRGTPPPPAPAPLRLPGLASAPSEAALDDRGLAVEGLAEFWAAAAAAAKVARFCNCRALIPGERGRSGVKAGGRGPRTERDRAQGWDGKLLFLQAKRLSLLRVFSGGLAPPSRSSTLH